MILFWTVCGSVGFDCISVVVDLLVHSGHLSRPGLALGIVKSINEVSVRHASFLQEWLFENMTISTQSVSSIGWLFLITSFEYNTSVRIEWVMCRQPIA